MGLGSIFSFFQPKDKVFFVLFEQMTSKLVAMADEFHNGVQEFDMNDDSFHKRISDYEHQMDELTHQVFMELGKNFITPFDREDIHALAASLDDIADYIFASSKNIFMYKAPKLKEYSDLTLLIQKQCIEIHKAVTHLKGFKHMEEVKESCIKINSIENIADDILTNSLVKLFEENDAVALIKAKSVLDYLEEVTDKAEDVANTIESIMVKYA